MNLDVSLRHMSVLQSLAKQKTDAELNRQLAALSRSIEAICHEHAAQGRFNSGATLKRVLAACKDATEKQRDTAIKEYLWAASQALLASQSWVECLVLDASQSIDSLHIESEKHIKEICEKIGKPDLVARLLLDLESTEVAAKNDIALALRSGFAERSRGLVRSGAGFVLRLLSRIIKGGAA
ncbi:hypothetical protein [Rhodoferax saidenbachensis]|nr:hypothetical protein [Rhodoferax saidenbachensis]